MAETKKELTVKDLEKQMQEMRELHMKEMQKVVGIANAYIKSYRDLLSQIRTTVDTHMNLEALLNKQDKE